MRGEASSDVFKVWLHAGASVLLGAWVSPLLYNGGKALAEVSSVKTTNGPLEWLAGVCRKADFPDFFAASLLIAAAVLFLPLVEWLRGGRAASGGKFWSMRLPQGARDHQAGQRLLKNPHGLRQAATGFLLVVMLFLAFVGVLILAGVLQWKNPGEGMAKILLRGLVGALVLAVFQEILFRGIAMGIFLRAMRPSAALGMAAVFFALVHFLNPPPGLNVLDPDASGVGFELLRKIAAQFSEPRAVLGTFTPLLALGGVLAYARWRTASLCLPVGLHAGWIFVNSLIASVTMTSAGQDSFLWVLSGPSLKQGLVPMFGILVAGVLANYLTIPDASTDTPA
ncbi:MAG: CPBP family intramembrane glutamic endopeptidase [Verrucomicrobiota bacterium]